MKFPAAIAILAGTAIAAPSSLEKRASLNYVQNYNGGQANFQYNLGAGTYTCSWNNPGDFVVGLGWTTGAARNIAFSGSYSTNSGSYYAVYGWLNSPLTEYYVVESGSYDPCSNGGSQVGSLTSDGSSYKICTHTQVNQPSIVGTATFGQFFSVRQDKRTSGTVTMANHFAAWQQHGFQPGNYNYQVMAVEAFGGSGSANVQVSEGSSGGNGGGTTTTTTNGNGGSPTTTTNAPTTTTGSSSGSIPQWGQCDSTHGCQSPYRCIYFNQYYSQCQ